METTPMTPVDYVSILKRRKWSLILPLFIVIGIGVIVAFALPSIYLSTSTILIEEQEIPAEYVMTTVTSYAEQRLQSINQRIMSFSRLLEVIQRFGLYPDLKDKWTTEEIVEKMREDTVLEPISAEIIDRRTGRPTSATIAFTLSYEGKDPNKVQQVANVLASLFLSENLQVREKQTQEASAFLESEMGKVREELTELESRIATFKEENINALPEMLQVNMQSLNNIERYIERSNEQLQGLKEKEEYYRTQLASVEPYLQDEEELARRKRMEELKVQLVFLTKRFSDEYPDVKKTRAEIAELQKQLQEADAASVSSNEPPDNPAYVNLAAQLAATKADAGLVQRQLDELTQSAMVHRQRIAATPKVEEAYNALLGARNNTQLKYDDLMRKHMEARVAQGLEKEQKGERFTLIDPARFPEKPYKPNRLAIMLIGLVLGIGAGIGMAAMREYSDDAVRDTESLVSTIQFPVLASIPEIITKRDIARKRWKRIAWTTGAVGIIVAGLVVFHFYVMDLDLFWARLMRRLAL
jgi:polysaccharide chain length determinant protein (PEP-CTERM system associated)